MLRVGCHNPTKTPPPDNSFNSLYLVREGQEFGHRTVHQCLERNYIGGKATATATATTGRSCHHDTATFEFRCDGLKASRDLYQNMSVLSILHCLNS